MTQHEAFEKLETLDREIVLIEHMASALSWDQEISLSELGVDERAEQMGYLSALQHQKVTSPQMGELLSLLDVKQASSEFEQALIRIRRREYEKELKLPSDLVRSISEQGSKAHQSWVAARKASDWNLFSKDFKPMVSLVKEKANLLKEYGQCLYDALLDEFEEGMTTSHVQDLFSTIKQPLVALTDRLSSLAVDNSFLLKTYPIDKQDQFAKEVLEAMKFDFKRGSRAISVHPFTTTIGSDDIRITTRYTDPSVMDSFCSSIHEGGHALYEMGASSNLLKGTSLANGASLGLHESQSRLWENMIAKSPAFWEHYYPRFKSLFGDQLASVGLDEFVRAVNKVGKAPIRVNADEVSYSLHIMLRFELEQKIINDEISIDDIPEAWDTLHEEFFGYKPTTIAEGALQDVHWSSGDFGYFPTYAIGNLYGAQIWEMMHKDLDVEALLSRGELGIISDYLKTNVYEKGALNTGLGTLEQVTSKGLDATLFTSYLETKFSRLFG